MSNPVTWFEIVGKDAAELIHILGVESGTADALKKLAGAAYNHPTRAEEILNAAETLASRWQLGEHVFGGPTRPAKPGN